MSFLKEAVTCATYLVISVAFVVTSVTTTKTSATYVFALLHPPPLHPPLHQ